MVLKHQLENKSDAEKKTAGTIFEDRIQTLRTKGKKRGKKYSFIGITISIAIFIFSMVMGYILFEQISQISRKVSMVNIKNNFQSVIDPDMRCENSCCLASLEKMRKYKYKEVDIDGECNEGFQAATLRCESSLTWCEPLEKIIKNNLTN